MAEAFAVQGRAWELRTIAHKISAAAKLTWWLGLLAFLAGLTLAYMNTKATEQFVAACVGPVLGMLGTNAISLVLTAIAGIAQGTADVMERVYKLDRD